MAHRYTVGNTDCSFSMLITAMNKAATVQNIMGKWKLIAIGLGVGSDVINKIERKILQDNWTASEIMNELLHSWRASASTDARLSILLEALDNHNLKDISNELRETFHIYTSNYSKKEKTNAPQISNVQPVNASNFHDAIAGQMFEMFANPMSRFSKNDPFEQNFEPIAATNTFLKKPSLQVQPKKSMVQHSSPQVNGEISSNDSKLNDRSKGSQNSSDVSIDDWDLREIQPRQYTSVSLKLGKPEDRDDDDYKLPGIQKGNGYALILNIIKYEKQGYRKGAQYDSFMLTQLFTQLGYKVIKYDDPNTLYNQKDVENIVERFRDYVQPKNPASVAVFVGCHGQQDEIQLSDETFTSLYTSVVDQFDNKNCSKLQAIPKIFIIESFSDADAQKQDNYSNGIICCAALPGNKEVRDADSGNHYLKSMVKVFAEKANRLSLTDLLDFTEGTFWKELPKHGIKVDNRPESMYVKLGGFETLYFNV